VEADAVWPGEVTVWPAGEAAVLGETLADRPAAVAAASAGRGCPPAAPVPVAAHALVRAAAVSASAVTSTRFVSLFRSLFRSGLPDVMGVLLSSRVCF
jgi:hypothetical protein